MYYFLILILIISIVYFLLEEYLFSLLLPSNTLEDTHLQSQTGSSVYNFEIKNINSKSSDTKDECCSNDAYRRFRKNEVINEELKKYNLQLTRALRTLEYISILLITSNDRTPFEMKELQDLKLNIQHEVLCLSKKIKAFQSHPLLNKVA